MSLSKSKTTVDVRLKLNDPTCIKARRDRLKPYVLEGYGIDHLEDIAPFLAGEIKRQELDNVKHPMWEEYRKQRKR